MWRMKSVTTTLSFMASVSVPSQRGATVNIVPRTVAAPSWMQSWGWVAGSALRRRRGKTRRSDRRRTVRPRVDVPAIVADREAGVVGHADGCRAAALAGVARALDAVVRACQLGERPVCRAGELSDDSVVAVRTGRVDVVPVRAYGNAGDRSDPGDKCAALGVRQGRVLDAVILCARLLREPSGARENQAMSSPVRSTA